MAQTTLEMVTMNQEVSSFVWATNPCLNPTGNKIAYQSSRRSKSGQAIQEIRVLDLMSGEERVVVEGAILIDWQDKNCLMFKYANESFKVGKGIYDVNNREVRMLQ